MRNAIIFVCACVLAAAIPWLKTSPAHQQISFNFPGWTTALDVREMQELSHSEGELRFEKDFPGRIGKFSDGEKEYAVRWVTEATRMLHPAADCLKGSGYELKPQPIFVDEKGNRWGCSLAIRKDQTLKVRERIFDAEGKSWTDVSSWYWAALMNGSKDGWWAVTVIEKVG
jgi:hypothetical protein